NQYATSFRPVERRCVPAEFDSLPREPGKVEDCRVHVGRVVRAKRCCVHVRSTGYGWKDATTRRCPANMKIVRLRCHAVALLPRMRFTMRIVDCSTMQESRGAKWNEMFATMICT